MQAASLRLHDAHLGADLLQAQWRVQPDGLALYKSAHILASDQRNMISELLLVQFDQPTAMPDFLLLHFFKDLRSTRKSFPQAFAKIGVNSFVLFLERNRQGKYFFLRQAFEVPHRQRLLNTADSQKYCRSYHFDRNFCGLRSSS